MGKPSRIFNEQSRVRSWSTQSTSQRTRRSTSYSLCITESREQSVRSHKSLLDDNDSGGSHWDLQSFTPPPSDEHKSDSSSKSVELACKGCLPNSRKNSSMHDPQCSRSPSCGSDDFSARLSNLEKGYGERKSSIRSRRSLRSRTASMRPIPEEKHHEANAEAKKNCLCSSNRTLLWVGIGVTLLILIVVVIVLVKRRTSGAASELEPDST